VPPIDRATKGDHLGIATIMHVRPATELSMLEGYLMCLAAADDERRSVPLKAKKIMTEARADGLNMITFRWARRLLKMTPEQREEVLNAFDFYVVDMKLDMPAAKLPAAERLHPA
jgi:hypothetical protein